MSLIEILVATGILSVMALGLATMVNYQARETRALQEKLAALDLERSVTGAVADSAACDAIFASGNLPNPGLITNISGASPTNPILIPINSIPATGGAGTVALINSNPSTMSNSLAIPANGLRVAVTSTTTANLEVDFDQTRLVRPLKKLSFPLTLATGGSAITGCSLSTSPLTPQQVCEQLMGLTYNTATNPPCILTNPTKDQMAAICAIMGGKWTGAACQLSMYGCTVKLASNVKQTLESLVTMANSKAFEGFPRFREKVAALLSKDRQDSVPNRIYDFVRIDGHDSKAVASFLEASDFSNSHYQVALEQSLGLDPARAVFVLTQVSLAMRGEFERN